MELAPDERVVFQGKLKKNSSREVTLRSEIPLWLCFETDASPHLVEEQRFAKRTPVRLEHKNGVMEVYSIKRSSPGLFSCVDGAISLVLRNETDANLTVRIISK